MGIHRQMHVPGVKPQEIPVVALFDKEILPVVTPVIDVIDLAVLEWHRI